MPKRELQGVVVSAKANKTVAVQVDRKVRHPIYRKFVVKSKKFQAHDEQSKCKEGDVVTIRESKPFSKTKTWEVVYSEN